MGLTPEVLRYVDILITILLSSLRYESYSLSAMSIRLLSLRLPENTPVFFHLIIYFVRVECQININSSFSYGLYLFWTLADNIRYHSLYSRGYTRCNKQCHYNSCLLDPYVSIPPHCSFHDDVIKRKHLPRYWPFVREFTGYRWNPRRKASDAKLWHFLWSAPE